MIGKLKYLGSKLQLVSSTMMTYSSSRFGHWTREGTASTKQNWSFSLKVLTCLGFLLFPWIEKCSLVLVLFCFVVVFLLQLRKRKIINLYNTRSAKHLSPWLWQIIPSHLSVLHDGAMRNREESN